MKRTVLFQFAGTYKPPEMTQMIQYNIFEIDQDRKTDTAQNNQKRNRDKQPIMISHHHRIAQIAGKRGEPGITESRNGMESRKSQFTLQTHSQCAVNTEPDRNHADAFNHQGKSEYI